MNGNSQNNYTGGWNNMSSTDFSQGQIPHRSGHHAFADNRHIPHQMPAYYADNQHIPHQMPTYYADNQHIPHQMPTHYADNRHIPHQAPAHYADNRHIPHQIPTHHVDNMHLSHQTPTDNRHLPHPTPTHYADNRHMPHQIPTHHVDNMHLSHQTPTDNRHILHQAPAHYADNRHIPHQIPTHHVDNMHLSHQIPTDNRHLPHPMPAHYADNRHIPHQIPMHHVDNMHLSHQTPTDNRHLPHPTSTHYADNRHWQHQKAAHYADNRHLPHPTPAHYADNRHLPHPTPAHHADKSHLPHQTAEHCTDILPHPMPAHYADNRHLPHPTPAHYADMSHLPRQTAEHCADIMHLPHQTVEQCTDDKHLPNQTPVQYEDKMCLPHQKTEDLVDKMHLPNQNPEDCAANKCLPHKTPDHNADKRQLPQQTSEAYADKRQLPHQTSEAYADKRQLPHQTSEHSVDKNLSQQTPKDSADKKCLPQQTPEDCDNKKCLPPLLQCEICDLKLSAKCMEIHNKGMGHRRRVLQLHEQSMKHKTSSGEEIKHDRSSQTSKEAYAANKCGVETNDEPQSISMELQALGGCNISTVAEDNSSDSDAIVIALPQGLVTSQVLSPSPAAESSFEPPIQINSLIEVEEGTKLHEVQNHSVETNDQPHSISMEFHATAGSDINTSTEGTCSDSGAIVIAPPQSPIAFEVSTPVAVIQTGMSDSKVHNEIQNLIVDSNNQQHSISMELHDVAGSITEVVNSDSTAVEIYKEPLASLLPDAAGSSFEPVTEHGLDTETEPHVSEAILYSESQHPAGETDIELLPPVLMEIDVALEVGAETKTEYGNSQAEMKMDVDLSPESGKTKVLKMSVCLTCGDEGFEEAIVYCSKCGDYAMHRYCLAGPVVFTDKVTWFCEDCEEMVVEANHPNSETLESEKDEVVVDPQPIADSIWSGSLQLFNKSFDKISGLMGHLSTLACPKVLEETRHLPDVLYANLLQRSAVWPESFKKFGTNNLSIGLYIFPENERVERYYDKLVDEMISKDLAIRVMVEKTELLIFPSTLLPRQYKRFHSKYYYLWGIFKRKQVSSTIKDT
ncbi:unnamed protein product [Vicia faba]|uniref:Zinc finger PHD-type domain-containing protein n=1 Tax=Vicia faba TaxID=3906 RepID=A0AAV0Z8R6_VICFA|nr:unnamed protein product [Vicia faba]